MRGDWEQARRLLRAGLDASDAAALEDLAWAAWWLADEQLTIGSRERAYRLYEAAGDAASAGRVATWLAADHREFRGAAAIGRGWLQRARRLLADVPEGTDHGWLALTEADFALTVDSDPEAVLPLARAGAAVGRRHAVADLEVVGLALEGLALVGVGSVEHGMCRLDEAAAIAGGANLGLPLAAGWALCCGLSACECTGDFPRARQWCDALARFADRWGGRQLLGVCRSAYGRILAASGDWARADDELTGAVRDLEQARAGMAGSSLARLGELRARQGRAEEARVLFERAGRSGVVGLGELALQAGDPRAAVEHAERALRRFPTGATLEGLPALELLAAARARLGEHEAAAEALAAVRHLASRCATPFVAGRVRLLAAGLAAARNDDDEARRAAEDAIDCFEDAAAPYDAALARVELAGALRRLGREDAAQREAVAARRALTALGARRDLARLDEARPAAPRDRSPRVLTPRELEVLRLVARGMSDAAIAEELVVSPHTVHRHVANIRAKLRLPSRAAAVGYAGRVGLL
jgi:DNA-binding NarL/FixJ family response regulator